MTLITTLVSELTKVGSMVATNARTNASWSSRIPGAISNTSAQASEGSVFVDIVVDIKKAPEAAAFEFGSGIHRTRGTPGTYEIRPENASVLAFEWNPQRVPYGSPKFAGAILESQETTRGKYFMHFVEHPGVAQRPYLQPAVVLGLDYLRTKFREEVRRGVISEIKAGLV